MGYLAAVEEGRLRAAEAAMTAHVKGPNSNPKIGMSPERMRRLSLFRVRPFFQKIDDAKKELEWWCMAEITSPRTSKPSFEDPLSPLDSNWPFTAPLSVGDEVEADLGGAFFSAKVSRIVSGNSYDVTFFDGDSANGLTRDQVKLLKLPS